MISGYLTLETGESFEGELIGNASDVCGEVVFNTSMTGYQEIMTDPSYAGQIVVFTYPLIGNYGVNQNDSESHIPHAKAIITSEFCSHPSHFTLTNSTENILLKHNIPCLTNVDTRELVKTIRKKGTVKGIISTRKVSPKPSLNDTQLVDLVTSKEIRTYENNGPHIMLMDFGFKKSILHYLLDSLCKVTVVPYDYPLEKIYSLNPDGIVISNGPGDPLAVSNQLKKIKAITQKFPTLGICLGHQLIALAYGGKTKKLLFGHRGGNHPVKDVTTGKVFITSQNHGYVVIDQTIDEQQFIVTFKHVNDGTIEGLEHRHLPIITVQFHPEAHPGPMDTEYIIEKYINLLKQKMGVMQYALQ
ncbi:carbamoyl phosphate synthase small subunit [Heyndrickxia sporothermodurans]|uniref:Carbamoyl phosphate synthase small chain n=1 Tax=Heyndrickxia sporothermodurans TaxID=46224 RepID=A0A150KPJ8_9BACI|nr:carbamoyl phosphate synthase small subunit [Heyndrickxia sporothermodurans]KYD00139.1 Carbamoyl-phosphate synthase small chain [Heyndrickxia sporothermodurans]PTY76643.1 carbamoyl phosphate synthase small subunit [Heyndrickxia sporothermodurans]